MVDSQLCQVDYIYISFMIWIHKRVSHAFEGMYAYVKRDDAFVPWTRNAMRVLFYP